MFRFFIYNHHQGASSYLIKLLLVYGFFLSMLAACHIVRVIGLDFLLLVLPCIGFLYLSVCYVMMVLYKKPKHVRVLIS